MESSTSQWVSQVLVQKKDKTTRYCENHRQLKNVNKDSYHLFWTGDILDTLAENKLFFTLDSYYHQFGIVKIQSYANVTSSRHL